MKRRSNKRHIYNSMEGESYITTYDDAPPPGVSGVSRYFQCISRCDLDEVLTIESHNSED